MLRLKGYNCITVLFLLAAEGRQLYVTTFNTSEGSHVLVYLKEEGKSPWSSLSGAWVHQSKCYCCLWRTTTNKLYLTMPVGEVLQCWQHTQRGWVVSPCWKWSHRHGVAPLAMKSKSHLLTAPDNSSMLLVYSVCMIVENEWTSQWIQLKGVMTKWCLSSSEQVLMWMERTPQRNHPSLGDLHCQDGIPKLLRHVKEISEIRLKHLHTMMEPLYVPYITSYMDTGRGQ